MSDPFEEVCARAAAVSKLHSCTVHVNAAIQFDTTGEAPVCSITGFVVDDWLSETTVCSYTNGHTSGSYT